jgi:hypothetical protein
MNESNEEVVNAVLERDGKNIRDTTNDYIENLHDEICARDDFRMIRTKSVLEAMGKLVEIEPPIPFECHRARWSRRSSMSTIDEEELTSADEVKEDSYHGDVSVDGSESSDDTFGDIPPLTKGSTTTSGVTSAGKTSATTDISWQRYEAEVEKEHLEVMGGNIELATCDEEKMDLNDAFMEIAMQDGIVKSEATNSSGEVTIAGKPRSKNNECVGCVTTRRYTQPVGVWDSRGHVKRDLFEHVTRNSAPGRAQSYEKGLFDSSTESSSDESVKEGSRKSGLFDDDFKTSTSSSENESANKKIAEESSSSDTSNCYDSDAPVEARLRNMNESVLKRKFATWLDTCTDREVHDLVLWGTVENRNGPLVFWRERKLEDMLAGYNNNWTTK